MINERTLQELQELQDYTNYLNIGQKFIDLFYEFLEDEKLIGVVSRLQKDSGEIHLRLLGCDLLIRTELRPRDFHFFSSGYLSTYLKDVEGYPILNDYIINSEFDGIGNFGQGRSITNSDPDYYFADYYFIQLVQRLINHLYSKGWAMPLRT